MESYITFGRLYKMKCLRNEMLRQTQTPVEYFSRSWSIENCQRNKSIISRAWRETSTSPSKRCYLFVLKNHLIISNGIWNLYVISFIISINLFHWIKFNKETNEIITTQWNINLFIYVGTLLFDTHSFINVLFLVTKDFFP